MDDRILHETDEGVFGLASVIKDFDDADLAKLRRLADAVRTAPAPDVDAAIALAGSAAQSEFQLFPADCDFFERVHIRAPSQDAAVDRLVETMLETVSRLFTHDHLEFVEAKLGLHEGRPIDWTLHDLDARVITVPNNDGGETTIGLFEAARDPGFVKQDWFFADDERHRLVPVSKVIDATWEAPDGSVVALDGMLDSFYQEVYLDPETRPHVERLIDKVKPDGLEQYIAQLEGEVRKCMAPGKENYGKVAKRLYNIFRVTHHFEAAAHLRGLFDDPPARLYTASSALKALTSTLGRRRLDERAVIGQIEELRATLQACYSGGDVDELVALAGRLRDMEPEERAAAAARIDDACGREVSAYFERELRAHDDVRSYLDELASR